MARIRFLSFGLLSDAVVWSGFAAVLSYAAWQGLSATVEFKRAVSSTSTYDIGDTISEIGGVDFDASDHTVLVVLRSNCRYCTASLELYKRLLVTRSDPKRLLFVALCVESENTCRHYLEDYGVAMDRVVSTSERALEGLRIFGTPTLLIVDRERRLKGVWRGWQREVGQRQISSLVYSLGL